MTRIIGDKLRAWQKSKENSERIGALRRTHGKTRTPMYRTWLGIRGRCLNSNATNYKWYGGRGITMCDRWNSFEAFLGDMGERPSPEMTLDRIDNDGPYSPENCRWAHRLDNARNRPQAHKIAIRGEVKSLGEWLTIYKMSRSGYQGRRKKGWTPIQAITTPLRGNGRFEKKHAKGA
jgi:hypothetical protein